MHRCFQVEDLIHLILEYMDPEITKDPSGGQPLLNLALTSKNFLPALDVLWHKQISMEPLLLVLPHDVWEPRNEGSDGARFSRSPILVRPLVKFMHGKFIDNFLEIPPNSCNRRP